MEGEISWILAAPLGFLPSLDHSIRSIQQGLRNRQADLLRSFQVDDELKLRGCSTGRLAGLGSLKILVSSSASFVDFGASARCKWLSLRMFCSV
jgi:hypothetical protein